jgi:nucleotide-binding universal stress UspA family protein
METRLLCAYDGSDDAEHAIAVAGQLMHGDAVVLYVWQPSVVPPQAGALPPDAVLTADQAEELDQQQRARAEEIVEQGVACARRAGFMAMPDLRAGSGVGEIWRAIVTAADDHSASLIVVGRRGASAIRTLLLGSIATGVVHHANVPVLVVPERDRSN